MLSLIIECSLQSTEKRR